MILGTMWNGEDTVPTLTASNAGGEQRMPDKKNFNCLIERVTGNQNENGGGNCMAVDCRNGTECESVNGTLQAKEGGGYNTNSNNVCRTMHIVRRLTPVECERLQGFPDNWSRIGLPEQVEVDDYEISYDDDLNEIKGAKIGSHAEEVWYYTDKHGKRKKVSDSARYRLQGNSIALPYWKFLLKRISAMYEGTPTLGSLFDGQGGFPLCWAQINGPESCRWSSEIDEYAEQVVRTHFGDEDLGTKGDYYEAIQNQFIRY